jgi:hypothetical protein
VHECTARLFSMIATNHGVSDAEIASARAERPAAFDSIVRGLFLPIYVLASLVVCRTIRRRFASDDGRVRFVALSLASVAVALLGSYLLVLWSMPWEAIRVGNGHIGGYRAATLNRHGPGIVFVVGLCLFWTVALLHRRVSARVTVGAAALSCAVLAAMFVRTFATGAVSWVVVSAVLVCVVAVLDAARDRTVADAETPSLRNT